MSVRQRIFSILPKPFMVNDNGSLLKFQLETVYSIKKPGTDTKL